MSFMEVLRWTTFYGTLMITSIFIIYATRIYWFALTLMRRRKKALLLDGSGDRAQASGRPFVSIMIPTYNEPNVVERILKACTHLDYEPYEVVVVDDSDDEVTLRLLELRGKWI